MTRTAAQYIRASQYSLFGFLFICFLLKPHFLLEPNEGGVSNYGLYAMTVVPYTLALGLCGLLIWRSIRFIPESVGHYRPLRRTLALLGSLFLLELISTYPYKINGAFNAIHIYAGVALFVAEVIIGMGFALWLAKNLINFVLLAAQLAGFTLAALTFFGMLHILFVAELLTSLAFGVLLVRTVTIVTQNPTSEKMSNRLRYKNSVS
jgi:hypothetical protein